MLSSQQAKKKGKNVKFNQDVESQAWSHLHYGYYSYIIKLQNSYYLFSFNGTEQKWAHHCNTFNFAMGQI